MRNDPLWRTTLYWGTVVSFFTLPLLVFFIHLTLIGYPGILHGNAAAHSGEFKYIFEFHRTLAALVFGLAGLHTGEAIVDATRRKTADKKPDA
jgi:hypothetical protein